MEKKHTTENSTEKLLDLRKCCLACSTKSCRLCKKVTSFTMKLSTKTLPVLQKVDYSTEQFTSTQKTAHGCSCVCACVLCVCVRLPVCVCECGFVCVYVCV